MSDEPPHNITKPWLEQWLTDYFYGDLQLLEQNDGSKGYFDRYEGLSSFRSFGYSWRGVYEHLDAIRKLRDTATE